MVIRGPHCLTDLLHRWYSNELDFEFYCLITIHNDLRSVIEWQGIAHYSVSPHSVSDGEDLDAGGNFRHCVGHILDCLASGGISIGGGIGHFVI